MSCHSLQKTLIAFLYYVISFILFNYAFYCSFGTAKCWKQAPQEVIRKYLLETTEQLRPLCPSVQDNLDSKLEQALLQQRELVQKALERNFSIPILIYTQSSSGWGNNILGLISTLLLAIVTKRALFVHFYPVKLENVIQDTWGVFPDVSLLATRRNTSVEQLMKQAYSIRASEHDQIWLSFTKQMERAYLNILSFDTETRFSTVVLQSNQFFAPLLYIRKDYNSQLCNLVGRFHDSFLCNKKFHHNTLLLLLGSRPFYFIANKVLQFTPEIQRAAFRFMQEERFHEKLVIGMQVRLKNDAPRWKKLNSLDRLGSTVQCAANVALQQQSPKSIVLFVATDHSDILTQIRKLFPFEISTFDSERANRYFSNDSPAIRTAKHAFVDIFLLSRTEYMISSWGSTFGYLAHGISGRPPFSVDLQKRCCRLLSSEPEMHHFYRVDNMGLTNKPYSSSIIEWMNMNRKARVVP